MDHLSTISSARRYFNQLRGNEIFNDFRPEIGIIFIALLVNEKFMYVSKIYIYILKTDRLIRCEEERKGDKSRSKRKRDTSGEWWEELSILLSLSSAPCLNKAAIHPTREQKSSAFTRAGFTKGELSQQVPRGVAGRQAWSIGNRWKRKLDCPQVAAIEEEGPRCIASSGTRSGDKVKGTRVFGSQLSHVDVSGASAGGCCDPWTVTKCF